jgi:hypothetical protein
MYTTTSWVREVMSYSGKERTADPVGKPHITTKKAETAETVVQEKTQNQGRQYTQYGHNTQCQSLEQS